MAGFNIANFNLYNFAKRFWDMFGNPTPMDVEVPQKNPNGDIETYLCPNLAKFKKRVWDDVGSALGQFDRTFYVDAVNGDDNNNGSSGSPFKTIKKACDSVPVGGYGVIHLADGDHILENNVELINKNIVLQCNSKNSATLTNKEIDTANNYYSSIQLVNSQITVFDIKLKTQSGDKSSYLTGLFGRANSGGFGNIQLYALEVELNDLDIFDISFGGGKLDIYLSGVSITKSDTANGKILNIENGDATASIGGNSIKINGNAMTAADLKANIVGLVTDANGVPRNVLTSYVL